jgi:hypothetical protein
MATSAIWQNKKQSCLNDTFGEIRQKNENGMRKIFLAAHNL